MGLAPATVVPRSDGEARVFLKDTVPDGGRALAQYRAWLSSALDGASLARLYADLFGRPLQHDVDVTGSFQDVLHRTLESCAQRGRPLMQLFARAVRARADRKEIVEQLAAVLGLAPVIEIAGLLAHHGCPETLCDEIAQALAMDRDASYLDHGHSGRAAWTDALVWLEELPAAAGRPPPLLDYLERLTTAWSTSHDGIPAEIARWLDDHRGPREGKRGDAPPAGASGNRAPGQQIRPASIPSSARYDLFLAHSPGGRPSAHALYSLLQGQIRVFLAERSIPPGDRWDREIAAAQRASRATAVLIAQDADDSWYLGDEIVTAIELHRAAPDTHRIIPVLLAQGVSVPYGLSHVQVLDASGDTLPDVAHRLRAIVASPSSA
ncbi:MAG TPA: toll/interleukin-1 receptor domain-containing protein [Kofleriaceae bacterium]